MGEPVFDEKRITGEFLELVKIDSESFHERAMADRLKAKLESIGFEVTEDSVGSKIGGNAGNLFATLKGNLRGEPILFAGHMDTVSPGKDKKPVIHPDGRITSDGTTVLGADDCAAIVEILEGIKAVRDAGIPHRDTEVIFAVAEEPFGRGSREFDYSKIRARDAYVLDATGKIGTIVVKAPTIASFSVKVIGRSAHAGFEPEKGINAIKAAAEAIAELNLGRIDSDSTLNIGLIKGGSVVNAVPAECVVSGEIRSYSHEKALAIWDRVKSTFEKKGADNLAGVETEFAVNIRAYETETDSSVVKRAKRAIESLGKVPVVSETFGGSDNNNLSANGIKGVVLSCGMYEPHTTREYTYTDDLVEGARLVAELVTSEE